MKDSRFYLIFPESPGSFGRNTVRIGPASDRPWKLSHLHYEFNCWPNNDIVCHIDTYACSKNLREAIAKLAPPATGIDFEIAEVSTSRTFEMVYRRERPDDDLGIWYWMKITGQPGNDDFSLVRYGELVVSQRILDLMQQFKLDADRIKIEKL